MGFLHATAQTSVEWMIYCLVEGTFLALFAWILLRLLPRQNSGTRFALWFSVLLAIVVLPFVAGKYLSIYASQAFPISVASGHSLITFSDSAAVAIFLVWAAIAGIGLIRVAIGLWQVHRIGNQSEEVDLKELDPKISMLLKDLPRAASLCVSDRIQVPAAIGLFQPMVVIPRWLAQEISAGELEQVMLHELAHLRRRDDWTNLAQKTIKALVFFHPSVWWLEHRLSLEREMACDEAVLAQARCPHAYAQCLTRLAERTLARKKLALAQAVVSRMRQLSQRVAQILDANRRSDTRLWKPAVPIVMAAAALCGLFAWNAPALVSFKADSPAIHDQSSQPSMGAQAKADLAPASSQPKLVLASAVLNSPAPQNQIVAKAKKPNTRFMKSSRDIGTMAAHFTKTRPAGDYVVRSEEYLVTMTAAPGAGPTVWRLSVWQVRIVVPSGSQRSTTVPRKNI